MKNKYLTAAAILLALTGLATSATLQHHPFSQIFPPNTALDFGGQNVANASRVETAVIEPNASDITFKDSGNVDILVYDGSQGRWELVNSNLYMGGTLNMAGNRITNVGAPSSSGDAVNKSYVDTSDDTIADNQNLQDVLVQGNDAGSNRIVNLTNPTNAQDAATKNYVDSNEINTDASTKCSSDQVLEGGNNCVTNYEAGDDGDSSSSNEIQGLSSVISNGNSAGGGNINNVGNSSFDIVYDSGQSRVELRSNSNVPICIGAC